MGKMNEIHIEACEMLNKAYNEAMYAVMCEKSQARELASYYEGMLKMYTTLTGERLSAFDGFHQPA